MGNFELLEIEVKNNGNCVNLGRSLKVRNSELYNWIENRTQFLNAPAKFTERIFCILNNIPKITLNEDGSTARFVNLFRGYCIKKQHIKKIVPKIIKSPKVKLSKLEEFVKRNRNRNAALYQQGLTEGDDYIVCPVSNERVSMIRKDYIIKVLGMTVDDYDRLYPGVRGICKARNKNIKKGLSQIDEDSGLTKYELGQLKARRILNTKDENGISGYARKGQATRKGHMANIDDQGRNGYSQLAAKAIIKGNQTKANRGLIPDPTLRNEFHRYKTTVLYLTAKHRPTLTRGYKTGLAGVDGAWHLDHNYSIFNGFHNKISPLLIANIKNLRMIPWEENVAKHSKNDITFIELLSCAGYTSGKSQSEFDAFMEIIKSEIQDKIPANGAYIMEQYYETKL